MQTLKISARKSDLARLQAYQIGQALKDSGFANISYEFSASLGDQNANEPLWQMPEKGVFTSDLTRALIDKTTDIVVHSWKDLPTEERPETLIAATLPRADTRDLLLVKKLAIAQWNNKNSLRVLSSSPRRSYHLQEFLKWALPLKPALVEFENVRGNIQTRVRKLLEGEAHALVVAKAALDRLLSATASEFKETQSALRSALNHCQFVVLPLSVCPGAAAQGALAVEVRRDRTDLIAALKKINCSQTYNNVSAERATLRSYGGGCHQKIGVTYLTRGYGQVQFVKGITDQGEVLNRAKIICNQPAMPRTTPEKIFPLEMSQVKFYSREDLPIDLKILSQQRHFIWISRDEALPKHVSIQADSIVWTAGLQTWRKLVDRGIWVSGSADGLGEQEPAAIDILVGQKLSSVKLAHSEAPHAEHELITTYKLIDLPELPNLQGKTHFFWASSSAFERALRRYPEIATAVHACGPGHTYVRLREILGPRAEIHLFLSYKDWRDAVLLSE